MRAVGGQGRIVEGDLGMEEIPARGHEGKGLEAAGGEGGRRCGVARVHGEIDPVRDRGSMEATSAEEEQQAQQDELNGYIAAADIVITTAQVPGRRPPLLVTADAVKKMQPGSVIVDVAASPLGGNVEVSRPGETVVTDEKITVIGAGTLPAEMPAASSAMYARNITALLKHLVRDGALTIDLDDEIQAGVIVAHGGKVVHAATAALLDPADTTAAPSGGAK